jgi:hypothetical protein
VPLTGAAKKAYQKAYMRGYARRKREIAGGEAEPTYCDFCGKAASEVRILVRAPAPREAVICNECAAIAITF